MLSLLRSRLQELDPKAREKFLSGDITLGQAHTYTTKRYLLRGASLEDLALRHTDHHAELMGVIPHIMHPVRDVEEFFAEVSASPRLVARALMRGQLTLVQARYLHMRSLGEKHIAEFTRRNQDDVIEDSTQRPKLEPRSVRRHSSSRIRSH